MPFELYHGTAFEFGEFDPTRPPVNDDGYMGAGVYFTSNLGDAINYAHMAGEASGGRPRVVVAQVDLSNPYRLPANSSGTYGMGRDDVLAWTADLVARGHDGVINFAGTEFVAFRLERIRILHELREFPEDRRAREGCAA